MSPPTSSERSRPPTPIACETPSPSRAIVQVVSCRPVPDAAARPMRPRGTALAKPSGTPSTMAVPQSGPIMSRPRSSASRFSATSVSTGTLSLNSITCSPARSAFSASAPAYAPGTEISARFASGRVFSAEVSVRGGAAVVAPTAIAFRASSACSAAARAASAAAGESAITAITRSAGPAAAPSGASRPACWRSSRLCGVPIMAAAAVTPGTASMSRESRMSVTESW